jgi:glycosyltransferase involved in cell wall biosynthesis
MRVAILHYSAPPVVGGVESVIQAHTRLLLEAGHSVMLVAGDGDAHSLPPGTEFVMIPELSTRHPEIMQASQELEHGHLPSNFNELVANIEFHLGSIFRSVDGVIVHNIFTKHFNLPLTAALCNLLDKGALPGCIAWCHDFTWTSPNSRSKVFPGYPWDLLRTWRQDVQYVTVSQHRQRELSGLFGTPTDHIEVIYNGVDPQELLGISESGMDLFGRLGLWDADLILLMPVRVTQAKNIELAIHLASALKQLSIFPKLVLTGPPDPHDQNNMAYFQELLALRHEMNVDQEMSFVYQNGPDPDQPFTVDMKVVGDLYRISDALFMPSHREGFGMPILEAGLVGLPVFCTKIPAAVELADRDVITFSAEADPGEIADLIMNRVRQSSEWRMRRRVRQSLTWQSIFKQSIMPLLQKGMP